MTIKIDIRQLTRNELVSVEEQLARDSPERHRRRLIEQDRGNAVYLIAWADQTPVGHVLLKWAGSAREPMASRLADCPEIEDLFAVEEHRSEGIGSSLLRAAEELAARNGYSRVGLGVGVENTGARALYERVGYVDTGLEYREHATWTDSRGRVRRYDEVCNYLVKRLQAAPDQD